MTEKTTAGRQIKSDDLYERQKQFLSDKAYLPGPVVVSAGLRTPENIGSVLRLADAAGCKRVLFIETDESSLQANKKLTRIARSVDKHLEIEQLSLKEFLQRSEKLPPLIAIELTSTSTSLFDNSFEGEVGFVIGNERNGIPEPVLEKCDSAIHIPMYGINGSMNVSHALAITLFEWRRQQTSC